MGHVCQKLRLWVKCLQPLGSLIYLEVRQLQELPLLELSLFMLLVTSLSVSIIAHYWQAVKLAYCSAILLVSLLTV